MPAESRPIVLTTRTLGSHTGVSQVALDVLLGLSRLTTQLRVRAWVPRTLPRFVDGLAVGPCRFEPVPLGLVARSVLAGQAPPRSLLEQLRLAPQRWLSPAAAPAALEVVNGLGAHELYARTSQRSHPAISALIVHESPRHFERNQRMSLAAALAALRGYDHRVFVSERGRAEWNALASVDPARSSFIPNCVQESRVARVRARDRAQLGQRFGYAQNQLQLVCVGSVTQRKGQDVLLAALRLLDPALPVRVDFLGPVAGAWAEQLVGEVKSSPLAARVRFLGSVDDVYERIYAADGLVLASRAEASPLSVLEAMALGGCVVATAVDGIAELVLPGQTGLLCAADDAAGLAACLTQLAGDPPLRAALGLAGVARYTQEFTRARQLARWAEAVTRMLT